MNRRCRRRKDLPGLKPRPTSWAKAPAYLGKAAAYEFMICECR